MKALYQIYPIQNNVAQKLYEIFEYLFFIIVSFKYLINYYYIKIYNKCMQIELHLYSFNINDK